MSSKAYRVQSMIVGVALLSSVLMSGVQAGEPRAYMIGLVRVDNKDWVSEYRPRTAELLDEHGGRVLARGKPAAVLEGAMPDADAMIVVEFPSVAKARAWYDDPRYQPLIELRQTGADVDFVLIKALAP